MNIQIIILITVLAIFTSCKTTLHFGDTYFESNNIAYSISDRNPDIQIRYQVGPSPYLQSLKEKYPLDDVLKDNDSDTDKVLKILNWTNSRWKHNGRNSPKQDDAISILKEAEEGGEFPCFAYAIVLRDQLNASGFKARTVYLKTKDAKKSKYPPGHVATEVYLPDLQKWIFIDGQFNVMPVLDETPLHAVEFQQAITNQTNGLKLLSFNRAVTDGEYFGFVYPYLYYLDTTLDNRYEYENPHQVDGKSSLMLVPAGARNLKRINFWDMDIDDCLYTNSILDFYAGPE
ncbi:MAG: transglutaminase domain-containing protein [Bacteroidales bacterium]|nr:transglutaminase domain-containing protein [Bacteroidales bacterium]